MGKPVLGPILLAEDSEKDAILTINVLKSARIMNPIDRVADGNKALHYLRCEEEYAGRSTGFPVVTLLDIKMPKMDGIETLREIRRDPVLKHLPVVMLTSSKEERDLIESYKLYANAYVVKPVSFEVFNEMMQQVGHFWVDSNEPPPAPDSFTQ